MNERRRKKLKKFWKLWWNSNTTPTAQETTLARPAPAESSATTSAHHTLATWVLETSKFVWSYVSPPTLPSFQSVLIIFLSASWKPLPFLFVGGKTQNNVIICFAMVFAVCNMFSGRRVLWEKGGRYACMIFSLHRLEGLWEPFSWTPPQPPSVAFNLWRFWPTTNVIWYMPFWDSQQKH